ncbi:hypothetical protein MPER_11483, partial [Moniliophthora perniciosa FA553]
MSSSQRLTDFHILFFDVYATLVDWETGIYDAMKPLLSRYPVSANWTLKQAIEEFTAIEVPLIQEHSHLPYRDLLAKNHELLEEKLHRESGDQASIKPDYGDVDRHTKFGQSIRNWPVFPRHINALRTLAKTLQTLVVQPPTPT